MINKKEVVKVQIIKDVIRLKKVIFEKYDLVEAFIIDGYFFAWSEDKYYLLNNDEIAMPCYC